MVMHRQSTPTGRDTYADVSVGAGRRRPWGDPSRLDPFGPPTRWSLWTDDELGEQLSRGDVRN